MNSIPNDLSQFDSLVEIIRILRSPNGCPWDRKQSIESITKYAIEEVYEFVEAVDSGITEDIKDELGDVLFQVILNSQIASEANDFNVNDVIRNINEKIVRRHPHVFSDAKAETEEEVLANWEEIKKEERKDKPKPHRRIDVSPYQPAIKVSEVIGKKSTKFSFDWEHPRDVLKKMDEEMSELKAAISDKQKECIESEIGDVLFTTVQLARHMAIDPEKALRKCNQRFLKRFESMMDIIENEGHKISNLSESEKEAFWTRAKQSLAQGE